MKLPKGFAVADLPDRDSANRGTVHVYAKSWEADAAAIGPYYRPPDGTSQEDFDRARTSVDQWTRERSLRKAAPWRKKRIPRKEALALLASGAKLEDHTSVLSAALTFLATDINGRVP